MVISEEEEVLTLILMDIEEIVVLQTEEIEAEEVVLLGEVPLEREVVMVAEVDLGAGVLGTEGEVSVTEGEEEEVGLGQPEGRREGGG